MYTVLYKQSLKYVLTHEEMVQIPYVMYFEARSIHTEYN